MQVDARVKRRRAGSGVRLFYQPTLLVLGAISVLVMGYTIFLVLHRISLLDPWGDRFVGFGNLLALLQDGRAWNATADTLIYVVSASGIELVAGVAIALFLNRDFPGRRVVRTLLLIPLIMTPVVAGLIWRIFYDPNSGIANYLLSLIGFPDGVDWLGDPHLAMASLILVDVWQWTPFVIVIVMAALESMAREPIEAAMIDGANRWQMTRYVILPLVRDAILVAATLRLIDSVKVFDIIYVMTRGGPALSTETLNMYSYLTAFNNFSLGYAGTIALVLTILVNVGLVVVWRLATGRLREA
jgi:multiple sugar transport system permease protein